MPQQGKLDRYKSYDLIKTSSPNRRLDFRLFRTSIATSARTIARIKLGCFRISELTKRGATLKSAFSNVISPMYSSS
jgi:hypothetical protein